MAGALTEHNFDLAPMEDEQPIEALPSDGAHEALGEGIGTWGPDWRAVYPDVLGSEDFMETCCELGVPIPD